MSKPTQEQVIAWAREAGLHCAENYDYRGSYEAMPLLEQQDFDKVFLSLTLAYEAGRKDSEGWKECVIEELIVSHIYSKQHENDPHKAIHDAISWNVEVALDPKVSKEAQDLFDRGYEAGRRDENEACARVCDELERSNLYGVKECAEAIRARGKE